MSENPELEPVVESVSEIDAILQEPQPEVIASTSNPLQPITAVPDHRPESITLIAVYQFLNALPGLIVALAVSIIAIPAVITTGLDRISLTAAMFGLGLVILFTGGLGLLSLASGFGLLKMKEWARWATIVLAIFGLPVIPIGTLISVFILFYLFKPETRRLFIGH